MGSPWEGLAQELNQGPGCYHLIFTLSLHYPHLCSSPLNCERKYDHLQLLTLPRKRIDLSQAPIWKIPGKDSGSPSLHPCTHLDRSWGQLHGLLWLTLPLAKIATLSKEEVRGDGCWAGKGTRYDSPYFTNYLLSHFLVTHQKMWH